MTNKAALWFLVENLLSCVQDFPLRHAVGNVDSLLVRPHRNWIWTFHYMSWINPGIMSHGDSLPSLSVGMLCAGWHLWTSYGTSVICQYMFSSPLHWQLTFLLQSVLWVCCTLCGILCFCSLFKAAMEEMDGVTPPLNKVGDPVLARENSRGQLQE